MKRLLKRQSAIDCNEFCNQIDLAKNELIRIMRDFSTNWSNFENNNNVDITDDCVPINTSNNPFNMNCDFGANFKNIGNYFTMFFNEFKENVKQKMGEIVDETENQI